MAKPAGWRKEPARHALASKGIRTNTSPRTTRIAVRWDSPRVMWARYADVIDASGDADDPYLQADVPMARRDEIAALANHRESVYDEYLDGIQQLENDLRNEVREYEEAAQRDYWDRSRPGINEWLPSIVNTILNRNDQEINNIHADRMNDRGPDRIQFFTLGYHDGQELMTKRLKGSGL